MKSFVTKYKYPETRKEIEHDEDDCPACMAVGPGSGEYPGGVWFVLQESDGKTSLRRVERVVLEPGLHASKEYQFVGIVSERTYATVCKEVTFEEADEELRRCGWSPAVS
jgi:hypothetical protein